MTKKESIKLFEEKKVRTVWDDEQEKWYFSISDIVEVLTDSKDPKQYIKKMKSRDSELKSNWGTICTLVQMTSEDGKKHKEMAASTEGIFRIIQSIPSPKAEPFKRWYATLTDIIYQTWAGKTAKEYKHFKGLKKENLRDNMTNEELVLNMLAELSTTSITKAKDPQNLEENMQCATEGGEVARVAREQLEAKTGRAVVSPLSAKRFFAEQKPKDEIETSE